MDMQSRSAGSERRRRRRIDRRSPASRWSGDELEDDGVVILSLRGSAKREMESRRTFQTRGRCEEVAVAAVVASGGDGRVRWRRGEREQRREKGPGREERGQGVQSGAEEGLRGASVASVTQASREVRGATGARALSPSSAYWQR